MFALAHNDSVFKPGTLLLCSIAVLGACSCASRQPPGSRAPDWEIPGTTAPVPETIEQPADLQPRAEPAPRAGGYAQTWIPLERWSREQQAGSVQRVSSNPSATFMLNAANGVFTLRANSVTAGWNGLELRLGFAPQLIDQQLYVHVLDITKNIEPLLAGRPMPTTATPIVVLDPGHGGVDSGTKSVLGGRHEKEFTLDWARRLQPLLEANGWQVLLTRMGDVDMPLSERVAFAERHGADLFLSLHFNSAAPSQHQAGLETYCLTPTGMPSAVTRGYADDVTASFPNNAFDAQNLQYAMRIHGALLAVTGNDRGVRRARFLGVLRGQNRPAVLIEAGYLSNPQEARRIADPAYRQRLAEAVARALGAGF
jgi:N-acetylmuramoyl-L-alanine amidase